MKLSIIFVVVVTVVFIPHTTCAQEEIILGTYYPAPSGEYYQLMADTLLMDPGDDDADQKTWIGFFDNNGSHEHTLDITTAEIERTNNEDSACIKLDGNAVGGGGDLSIFAGRGPAGGPYGDIRFYTSQHPAVKSRLDVPQMWIHPDGNFNIGTLGIAGTYIDPDAMLTIGRAMGPKYNVAIKGSAAGPKIFLDEFTGLFYEKTGVFGIDGADDAFLIRQITNSGTNALLLDVQTSTARNLAGPSLLSVLHNGNVGIGTNTPTAGLHITNPNSATIPNIEGVQIHGGATSGIEITSNAGGSAIDFNNLAEGNRDYDARLALDPAYDGVLGVTFYPGAADAAFIIQGVEIVEKGVGIGPGNLTAPLHITALGVENAPSVEGVQVGRFVGGWFGWSGMEITGSGGAVSYIDFQNDPGVDWEGRILLVTGNMLIASTGTLRFSGSHMNLYTDLDVTEFGGFNNSVHVNGNLTCGGSKPFIIDHPTKPGLELIHACIEGPEAGLYYRGDAELVNGQALIRLPEYFETLTRPEDRTVLLTARGREPFLLSYTDIVDGKFTVYGTKSDGEFYWEVKAVRGDVEPLVIERPKVHREEVPKIPDFVLQQAPSPDEL